MEKATQIINNTAYHSETPAAVVRILENKRQSRDRIRMFYGDQQTGKDWKEEWDNIGRIGRSTGNVKIPLLIKTARSRGGSGILDHCIVKIQSNGTTLYSHPSYHLGEMNVTETPAAEYKYHVFFDGTEHAAFKTKEKMQRYIDFITGKSNRH